MVGQQLPDRKYDGVDLLSKVNTKSEAHDYLYYRKGFNRMIRTSEYKLIWNAELDSDTLLYHIVQDPGEQNNVYHSNRAQANKMFSEYREWEKELQAPLWPSVVHFNYKDANERVFVFEN